MTWLKFLNVFILQLLFIRLTKCQLTKVENFKIHSWDVMPNGDLSCRGTGTSVTYQHYSIQYWIVPLSGWWSSFPMSDNPKFIQITKSKKI